MSIEFSSESDFRRGLNDEDAIIDNQDATNSFLHIGEDYDDSFLDKFEAYVELTCGGNPRLSINLKAEGRKWFDGLRRFVSECRARRPVVDREDLSAFEEIQCRIIGGSLIAWLREHGPRLVQERAVLAEFQNCENDPIIVITSGQPGLVAAREILRKGPANIVLCFQMSSRVGSMTIRTQTIAGTFTHGLASSRSTQTQLRRLRDTHVLKENRSGCTKREQCADSFSGVEVIIYGNGTDENLNCWKKA